MKKFILGYLLFLSLESFSAQEIYVSFPQVGFIEMDEVSNGLSYTNGSEFLGHLGLALGYKAKVSLGKVEAGIVSELAWVGDTMVRTQVDDLTNKTTLRTEAHRLLAGGALSFPIAFFRLEAEYYPYVKNYYFYSDNKSENIFQRSSNAYGTGWGGGISFGSRVRVTLLLRKLEYSKLEATTTYSFPDEQYSKLRLSEFLLSVGGVF